MEEEMHLQTINFGGFHMSFSAIAGWHGISKITLPKTNSSPLQMDGWNTILSYWVSAYFQGQTCC